MDHNLSHHQGVDQAVISGFTHLRIAVPDFGAARQDYEALLGQFSPAGSSASLALFNIRVELVERPELECPRIEGLGLWSPDGGSLPGNCRQLPLELGDQRPVSEFGAVTVTGVSGVDHLVLRTADADDCIRLFGDELGMRLALDQSVPEWGGRMLFFRCGKMTLEVIHNLEEPPAKDFFWGITYLCPDLELTLAALDQAGVEHSNLRKGRKPGTRVATVKSHNLGLPTLLIEPAAT